MTHQKRRADMNWKSQHLLWNLVCLETIFFFNGRKKLIIYVIDLIIF